MNPYVSNRVPQAYLNPNQNTTRSTMTICNDFFILCKTFPQPPSSNALSFVKFTKVQILNKNTQCPLYSTFGFLFASPSSMHVFVVLSSRCHPACFLFLNNNRTWFKVELTLKVVKSSLSTLILNACLLMYIQPIP